jgi:hypothetical protein
MDNMNKEDYYYDPLPGSDSRSDQCNNNNDNGENNSEEEYQKNNIVHHLNKYALAGAILASTNSILLGYGKFNFLVQLYIYKKECSIYISIS